jgi:hypothetical protein
LAWSVEATDEFENWWQSLDDEAQVSVSAVVALLEELGPDLPFPYSSAIRGSRHGGLRELRIQHRGRPIRILCCFDPRRVAVLCWATTRVDPSAGIERRFPEPSVCSTGTSRI